MWGDSGDKQRCNNGDEIKVGTVEAAAMAINGPPSPVVGGSDGDMGFRSLALRAILSFVGYGDGDLMVKVKKEGFWLVGFVWAVALGVDLDSADGPV
ncbi:hypothetical protein MRB53_006044 [Persea americana]|uniref:Uncharacterized protein n=1 Tax=Persea americana TaxID=3435 RepID=A0ACC2MF92_PERAE|nr:hypothetical protein MRB53_006044 [Persea americana]